MIDYSKLEHTSAEPEACSMIETFRSIGYSIETAIADIIDNSITAGAKNIWIDYDWQGTDTVLSIMDDGCGMNDGEIIQAMRPGSTSPLTLRPENDLGRFGLGLKTASFSQCRKFCVISKTIDHPATFWSWDLDYVNAVKSWQLLKYRPDFDFIEKKYSELRSGSVVLWWDIDRLTRSTKNDSLTSKELFQSTMDTVKKHLAMVFHRYIEDGLHIFLWDREIEAWNPFMLNCNGLQPRPEAQLENGRVKIKGFVLPHRSKLTPEEYTYGKGPKDSWTAQQGFYVYRNRRLLVAGDWLNLFKREVHYDLCRIRIDIPNSMDNEWQIDIKKSVARPPADLRAQISSIARDVREQAVEVYRHRGKVIQRKLARKEYFPFWEEKARHGKRFYKLSREHPILRELLEDAGPLRGRVENALQFIEETVPLPLITLQESENTRPHGKPFEGKDHEIVKNVMKSLYESLLAVGNTSELAKARIANIEPFNFYTEYLEQL